MDGRPAAKDGYVSAISNSILLSGKLFREGRPVKIQPQPLRVLGVLLERPGEIVSREQLRTPVWGDATFVEFDQGLNYCIRQIRLALRDGASEPLYIETLPKQGYRFIGSLGVNERPAGLVRVTLRIVRNATEGAESARQEAKLVADGRGRHGRSSRRCNRLDAASGSSRRTSRGSERLAPPTCGYELPFRPQWGGWLRNLSRWCHARLCRAHSGQSPALGASAGPE